MRILNWIFFFNPTEKVIEAIIVEFNEFKIIVDIYYGQKIGTNCSEGGSNGQILINHAKLIFGHGNPYNNRNLDLIKISR